VDHGGAGAAAPGHPTAEAAAGARRTAGGHRLDVDRCSPGADLDLAGFGLLGDGDAQCQPAVGEVRLDVFGVEALAEMHLPAIGATVPFGQLHLVTFLASP
jgi:hypothetical protein